MNDCPTCAKNPARTKNFSKNQQPVRSPTSLPRPLIRARRTNSNHRRHQKQYHSQSAERISHLPKCKSTGKNGVYIFCKFCHDAADPSDPTRGWLCATHHARATQFSVSSLRVMQVAEQAELGAPPGRPVPVSVTTQGRSARSHRVTRQPVDAMAGVRMCTNRS